jgi:hypothetical protein
VYDTFSFITLQPPAVTRVRFLDVNQEELCLILVLPIKLIERGNLPAKRRSSIAAKD